VNKVLRLGLDSWGLSLDISRWCRWMAKYARDGTKLLLYGIRIKLFISRAKGTSQGCLCARPVMTKMPRGWRRISERGTECVESTRHPALVRITQCEKPQMSLPNPGEIHFVYPCGVWCDRAGEASRGRNGPKTWGKCPNYLAGGVIHIPYYHLFSL